MFNRIYREEAGVLTFEWILLVTVLVIGIVGALSAVRDALNTELGDVAEAMIALDQSYYIIWPWEVATPDTPADGASDSYFKDGARIYQDRPNSSLNTVVGSNTATGQKVSQDIEGAATVQQEGTTVNNFNDPTGN